VPDEPLAGNPEAPPLTNGHGSANGSTVPATPVRPARAS